MFTYYNPHPKGKFVNDCVKRAITIATGLSYNEVQRQLNATKRELGLDVYNNPKVWEQYLLRNGFERINFPATKGVKRVTPLTLAINSNKNDIYVCRCAKHLVTVTDNQIFDTWDSSVKCVYFAYYKSKGVDESQ